MVTPLALFVPVLLLIAALVVGLVFWRRLGRGGPLFLAGLIVFGVVRLVMGLVSMYLPHLVARFESVAVVQLGLAVLSLVGVVALCSAVVAVGIGAGRRRAAS